VPDEGGSITVHSATQSVDAVQRVVASTLGIPFHQVRECMSQLLSYTATSTAIVNSTARFWEPCSGSWLAPWHLPGDLQTYCICRISKLRVCRAAARCSDCRLDLRRIAIHNLQLPSLVEPGALTL